MQLQTRRTLFFGGDFSWLSGVAYHSSEFSVIAKVEQHESSRSPKEQGGGHPRE